MIFSTEKSSSFSVAMEASGEPVDQLVLRLLVQSSLLSSTDRFYSGCMSGLLLTKLAQSHEYHVSSHEQINSKPNLDHVQGYAC